MPKSDLDGGAILQELVSIKKLIILALYASNVPSDQINKAVEMGAGNIRRMFSKKSMKNAKLNR
jgi:hypothetical protein